MENVLEEGAVQCVQCGYSLEGLPASGACPECGRAYDSQCIRLWGKGRVSRGAASLNLQPPHRFLGYFNWSILIALFLAIVVGDTVWNRGPSFLPCAAIVVIWTYLNDAELQRSRIAVQVWLARNGYGTRRGHGALKLRPWGQEDVDFRKRPEGGYWFVIRRGLRTMAYLELNIADAEAAALRQRLQELTGRRVWLEQ